MRFRAPVRRDGGAFVLAFSDDEGAMVTRLLGELRELLGSDTPDAITLTARLFPVVHPDDPEQEAEYQRLMREELVESRLEAVAAVERAIAGARRLDEAGMVAFMQSVNSVRLVLGTMLGITDDPSEGQAEDENTYEYQLYSYLSWLLEWSVRALSGA